jgi:hypothetical protein
MHAQGISKAELARRIGISPQQAQRLFDIHHTSRLDQIEAALAALGRRLIVSTDAVRPETTLSPLGGGEGWGEGLSYPPRVSSGRRSCGA